MDTQTTQLLVVAGSITACLGTVAVALSAGFRMGKGDQHLTMRQKVVQYRKSSQIEVADTQNTPRLLSKSEALDWSTVGLRASLVLFVLALLGFGSYYFGIQSLGKELAHDQAASDASEPVSAATQTLIDKSKALAATGSSKQPIDISTKDWKEYRDENSLFTLLYPSDFRFDQHATGQIIEQTDVLQDPDKVPKLVSAIRLLPISSDTPVVTITTYTNPAHQEAGSFSSLYALYPVGAIRSAFQLNGVSAVKFSLSSDTDRTELTYVGKSGADKIVTLELRGTASVMTDPTVEWETLKTVAAKFKLR